MSEEQKAFAPCPFCADEVAFIEPDGDGIYHAECQRCGAHGPVESAEDRAISSWNRRILVAAPDDGFNREELQALVALSSFETRPIVRLANLAAYALTLLDENERLSALAAYGLACFDETRSELADLDGSWLQDKAVELGLLREVHVTEPCGDCCRCAEWDDFPQDCLRETEAVKAARSAFNRKGEG